MNKRQHTLCNIILFLLFSVMVSIYPMFKGMNSGGGWGLAWFVVLYFAAAWFRLYYNSTKNSLLALSIWLGSSLIIAVGYIFAGGLISVAKTFFDNQYRYDSIFAYISSLCLLAVFINVKIQKDWLNKAITFVAPSILGVYLIHAHSEFSPWSWEFLNMPQYMGSMMFIIIQISVVLAIMTFCVVIDIIRRYTIGRIESSRIIVKLCNNIELKVKNY